MTEPAPAITRAVVDSNIIFSRVLDQLFGRLAREARLFDLMWSDELLAETKRALINDKPVSEPVAERWISYMVGDRQKASPAATRGAKDPRCHAEFRQDSN